MNRTGTFATPEQVERMKSAMNMPLVALNAGMPRTPQQVAHDCALEAGLPEIDGYYGCDLHTGEFVAA